MSLTFINIEDSPDKPRTFGLGSGFLEDFLHNPLEQLRTLKYDKTNGSWDIDKIKEILKKINNLAIQNNFPKEYQQSDKHIQRQQQQIHVQPHVQLGNEFNKLYSSFNQSQEYDNKNQRVKQMVQDYQNRVIRRSTRPSSVQPKQIEQPQKCKLMSNEFQKKLKTIDLKYGMKSNSVQAKSRYLNHREKTIGIETVRPHTTRTNIRGYFQKREKMFDLDQKFMRTSQTSRRRTFSAVQKDSRNNNSEYIMIKIMKKCDKELKKKIDPSKYDLENRDVQPTFMLDDSDSQMKRLTKCIKFNPYKSIRSDLQNKMPDDDDFILKQSVKISREREKRKNSGQKAFMVKANSLFDEQA